MEHTSSARLALLLALALSAVDARTGRFPNWLTLPVLALGCLLGSPLGALAGGVLPLCLWLRAGAGAGDVKALAAVGAWLGPVGAITAAAFALALAGSRGRIRAPLGYALAAGVFVALALN